MSTATAVKERPILFSGHMVRAILDGRKTQTRRIVKGHPLTHASNWYQEESGNWWCSESGLPCGPFQCPYGHRDERLWVREAWGYFGGDEYLYQRERGSVGYRATHIDNDRIPGGRWRPSIHMPRWASRILLELTDVRVQRLQEISPADAWAEGVRPDGVCELPNDGTFDTVEDPAAETLHEFRELWLKINGPESWEANPWVWAISFRQVTA